ncbi:phytoene/squalene synthase family protein [Antrihabitans cavernicola]|uniref:Phytoene/squalene synthase family protein n=2 Tax=Antrihabitans cavernicola TaxID=2495913 RepID=A0A5A7SAS2_9NOCA|nr:phytoene/squalene synthase family protein [Spelaeibacter cavernicola]
MLHPTQRPAVYALYGFARYADDIVDEPASGTDVDTIATQLTDLGRSLRSGLDSGHSAHPVLAAVVDTVGRYQIDPALFAVFLDSMLMDLTVTDYPNRAVLSSYVHGSAEVIGLQMLPVLGTVTSRTEAVPYAAALGHAFQLTNFLRDIAEDLDRGRIYLPADELATFDVDRDRLLWCRRTGRLDNNVRRALEHQIAYVRSVYREAKDGIVMLHPISRPCVATAFDLYGRILNRIEDQDFNVFAGRATVGTGQRIAVAARAAARTVAVRASVRTLPTPAPS